MGDKEEVEEMRGVEEDKESGEWVSGLVDDLQEALPGVPRLSPAACSSPSSLPPPHPSAPSLNPLSHEPLNPSRPLTLSRLPDHTQVSITPSFPRQMREARQKNPSQLLMARVPWPDCCWWRVQLGAGGAGQWPARVPATT